MERRGLLERLKDWLSGKSAKPYCPADTEHSVWNEPAPASRAGDAPIITSHGQGPSHAH